MTTNTPTDDEIDIDEAMRLTGKSRATLMRWKKDGKLTTRTEVREFTQKQPRLVFRRSEIKALAGDDAESAGCGTTPGNGHTTTGEA